MLRERPFDIFAGQEDVFGPGYFFHDTILSFYFHYILLLLPKDNKNGTIALNLSWIFFVEKKR